MSCFSHYDILADTRTRMMMANALSTEKYRHYINIYYYYLLLYCISCQSNAGSFARKT